MREVQEEFLFCFGASLRHGILSLRLAGVNVTTMDRQLQDLTPGTLGTTSYFNNDGLSSP